MRRHCGGVAQYRGGCYGVLPSLDRPRAAALTDRGSGTATAKTHRRGGWLVLLLAAVLTGIVTMLLGLGIAGTASAATTSTVGGSSTTSGSVAGTRVGVSSSDSILAVGVDSSIAAGQRRGTLLSQPQLVSGLCVAAEANDAARDFPGDAVRAKIPDEWGPGKPAAKGNGWRWQPDKNGKNYVRVDPGDPASPQPLQQVDHVHVTSGGRQVADHLPLSDWLNWSSWSTP